MATVIRTNNDARAALGVVAQLLGQGYREAATIGGRAFVGGDDVQAASLEFLDQVNTYAQRVYASLPADNGALSAQSKKQLALVQAQAKDAVKRVGISAAALDWTVVDLVQETAQIAGDAVGSAARAVGKGAGSVAAGLFGGLGIVMTIVVIGVVAVVVFGFNPLKLLKGK